MMIVLAEEVGEGSPAQAGIDRRLMLIYLGNRGFPRTGGDRPPDAGNYANPDAVPPHRRG